MDSSDSGPRVGLFTVAWALSITGLIACLLGWGLLAALMMPGADDQFSQAAQRYVATVLAMLSLSSLMVHLACRILRSQRRIARRQEQILALLAQEAQEDAEPPAVKDNSNVLAFQLGRRVGRADRAPTLLPD